MELLALVLALGIVAASGLASGIPIAAWSRTRDPRFLLVAGADLALLALGIVWAYGELPVSPPGYAASTLPALALAAVAAVLLLATGLIRRRA
jgi:hypothetical protein